MKVVWSTPYLDVGYPYPRLRPTSLKHSKQESQHLTTASPKEARHGLPSQSLALPQTPKPRLSHGLPSTNKKKVHLPGSSTLIGAWLVELHVAGFEAPVASWLGTYVQYTYSSSPAQIHHLPEFLNLEPICP